MKEKVRKIAEIVLLISIVSLSIAIFVHRNQISNISNVGYLGLFVLCCLANATVLLPAPSLLIAASCALIMNPLAVAIVAALGSSTGELVGYLFGSAGKDISPKFQIFLGNLARHIHNDLLLVFILAVLPLPLFDFIGIYSGGTKMNIAKFFAACFVGKFIKMLIYTRLYDIMDWASSMLNLESLL